MKRTIYIFFLLLVIGFTLTFSFLYLCFNFLAKENFINVSIRNKVIKNITLRKLFKLYQVGDARYDYATNSHFNKLEIALYQNNDLRLTESTKQKIIREFGEIIEAKEITIKEYPVNDLPADITDDDLNRISKKYPVKLKDSAILQIFVLNSYSPSPTYAGLVKNAYSIFLFMKPIQNISNYESSTYKVEESTILHEFAHLLGAGHVDGDYCILTEKAENLNYGRPTRFATTYCQEDLDEIKNALL